MGIAIFGLGGFAREVAAAAARRFDGNIVFVTDRDVAQSQLGLFPVLNLSEFCGLADRPPVVVALADFQARKSLTDLCVNRGLVIGTFLATTALVSGEVGAGSIFCDNTMVTADARIGKSFQCNIYSYVAHDCVIGDYVTFAPRVSCNGNVHIGDRAYIGTASIIVPGTAGEPMTIGEGAVVGAGAVVTKPVEPYTVVVGAPARVIRTLDRPA
jgi:sugar O-acyltransferase (sialic acid O-acetyltransferase NeuD family)